MNENMRINVERQCESHTFFRHAIAIMLSMTIFSLYTGALALTWSSYYDDARECNYAVDALIIDKAHHPKYSGECLLTLEWALEQREHEHRKIYRKTFDVSMERCDDMEGSGMYIRGCVKATSPERLTFDQHERIVPWSYVRAQLRRALIVTVFVPMLWLMILACLYSYN